MAFRDKNAWGVNLSSCRALKSIVCTAKKIPVSITTARASTRALSGHYFYGHARIQTFCWSKLKFAFNVSFMGAECSNKRALLLIRNPPSKTALSSTSALREAVFVPINPSRSFRFPALSATTSRLYSDCERQLHSDIRAIEVTDWHRLFMGNYWCYSLFETAASFEMVDQFRPISSANN